MGGGGDADLSETNGFPTSFSGISEWITREATELYTRQRDDLRKSLPGAATLLNYAYAGMWGALSAILNFLLWIVMLPFFTYYLLADFHRIRRGVTDLFPLPYRADMLDLFGEIDQAMSGLIRGQLMVVTILGVVFAFTYELAGVRGGMAIGIFTGLATLIPYIGSTVGLTLAILATLLDPRGFDPWVLGRLLLFHSIILNLESVYIIPKVVGDRVGLPAIVVICALIAGGHMAGVAGALSALPIAAVARILLIRATRAYKRSSFYRDGWAEGEHMIQQARQAAVPAAAALFESMFRIAVPPTPAHGHPGVGAPSSGAAPTVGTPEYPFRPPSSPMGTAYAPLAPSPRGETGYFSGGPDGGGAIRGGREPFMRDGSSWMGEDPRWGTGRPPPQRPTGGLPTRDSASKPGPAKSSGGKSSGGKPRRSGRR